MILGLVGLFIGLAGVVATIYYARRSLEAERARRRLEWADLQSAASDLARRIKRTVTPVAIVTPGLTGATFANLLAAEFPSQPPVFVGIRVWREDPAEPVQGEDVFTIETKKWTVLVPRAPSRYREGTILIVDDFVMSGDFLEELKQRLVGAGVARERICSASIVATRVAIQNHKAPDFYWFTADDDNFYFPWGKAR